MFRKAYFYRFRTNILFTGDGCADCRFYISPARVYMEVLKDIQIRVAEKTNRKPEEIVVTMEEFRRVK